MAAPAKAKKKARKPSPTEAVTREDVLESLSGACLEWNWWGTQKAFDVDERGEAAKVFEAEEEVLNAKKRIIDIRHPAWRDLTSFRGKVKSWWEFNSYPYPVKGTRVFLIERRKELFDHVLASRKELQLLVKALDRARPAILKQAEQRMKKLFDPTLYPGSWEGEFNVALREVSISPPNYLAYSDEEAYRRDLNAKLAMIAAGQARFEQECWQRMAQTASQMIGNLLPGGTIQSANLDSFQKLFGRVVQMRFDGTAAFKSAMEEARSLVEGLDIYDLRADKKAREDAKGKLESLLKRYGQLQEAIKKKQEVPAQES